MRKGSFLTSPRNEKRAETGRAARGLITFPNPATLLPGGHSPRQAGQNAPVALLQGGNIFAHEAPEASLALVREEGRTPPGFAFGRVDQFADADLKSPGYL